MWSLRVAGVALLLVVVLGGCMPVSCPWSAGEALLQNSWQTYQGCRR